MASTPPSSSRFFFFFTPKKKNEFKWTGEQIVNVLVLISKEMVEQDRIFATFRVARLALQTPKLWLVCRDRPRRALLLTCPNVKNLKKKKRNESKKKQKHEKKNKKKKQKEKRFFFLKKKSKENEQNLNPWTLKVAFRPSGVLFVPLDRLFENF